eukprot:m.253906 g.253906  ORF g.253906 m.253906 type:complete len:62 (-) comp17530_c0_seq1:289-474(-)
MFSALRSAARPQAVRFASVKKAEDPVKDAFIAKLKEYAKNRDPNYTQNMIKNILKSTKGSA